MKLPKERLPHEPPRLHRTSDRPHDRAGVMRYADQTSRAMAGKMDDEIRTAILRHTGESEIVLADVARLGVQKIMPDGTIVFAYDGVDLLRFWPIEFHTDNSGDAFKVTVSQKFQKLA